jgi:type II secretory pathway pseudopilin PulG
MNSRCAEGFSLVELVFVAGMIGLITAIAIPGLIRARMAGNEASAIGSMHAIINGEVSYSASCMPGGFAVTLDDLAKEPTPGTGGFVSPDIGHNGAIKSGYFLSIEKDLLAGTANIGSPAATCNGSVGQPVSSYFASAKPGTFGISGNRYFAADTRNRTFQSAAGPIVNPLTPGGPVVPVQ